MKRLYNKYGACPTNSLHREHIERILNDAFKKIWSEIEDKDICPRDTELLCHNILSNWFAETILVKAFKNFKPLLRETVKKALKKEQKDD